MNRNMEREDRFEKALHSVSPIDSLRALVHDLSAEGCRKPQIVALFEQLLIQLQNEPAREADADAVRDVLDFLMGWCSPHMKLLQEEGDVSSTPPR
ncbi:MAG TPA: hypothetical protein VMF69_19135 [Gemmataceae bacterium]|nr:hypothetical protein [Gemmataceae bacterium]